MKKVMWILVVLGVAGTAMLTWSGGDEDGSVGAHSAIETRQDIWGGKAVKWEEFPWAVVVRPDGKKTPCTGTLLTPSRVLTSGSCCWQNGTVMKIFHGPWPKRETHFIYGEAVLHHQYEETEQSFHRDLCLVLTFEPVPLPKNLHNFPHLDLSTLPDYGQEVWTFGFGATRKGGNPSNTLHWLRVPVVCCTKVNAFRNKKDPKEWEDNAKKSRFLCVKPAESTQALSCHGDRGAGMFDDKKLTIYGVLSDFELGKDCDDHGAAWYTNAASYWKWMKEQVDHSVCKVDDKSLVAPQGDIVRGKDDAKFWWVVSLVTHEPIVTKARQKELIDENANAVIHGCCVTVVHCSGSLIKINVEEAVVLTAAHCCDVDEDLQFELAQVSVRFGAAWGSEKNVQILRAIYPQYDGADNDICLLSINRKEIPQKVLEVARNKPLPVLANEKMMQAVFGKMEDQLTPMQTAGFGRIKPGRFLPKERQTATLYASVSSLKSNGNVLKTRSFSHKAVDEYYDEKYEALVDKHEAAETPDERKAIDLELEDLEEEHDEVLKKLPDTAPFVCHGDSGGPLFLEDVKGVDNPVIFGVLSEGSDEECIVGGETSYANVASLENSNWIPKAMDAVLESSKKVDVSRLKKRDCTYFNELSRGDEEKKGD